MRELEVSTNRQWRYYEATMVVEEEQGNKSTLGFTTENLDTYPTWCVWMVIKMITSESVASRLAVSIMPSLATEVL